MMESQADLFLKTYEKEGLVDKMVNESVNEGIAGRGNVRSVERQLLSSKTQGPVTTNLDKCICTVLHVKPYSGYYQSCLSCKRKLRTLDTSTLRERTRYWCNKCRVKFEPDEPGLCYCLILTVTDPHPPGTKVVSLFGQTLNGIFGLQAKQMHRYMTDLEGRDEIPGYELLIKALRSLLIGACVELNFAKNCSSRCNIEQRREMGHHVATGIKILGANDKETVFSLLSIQKTSPLAPLHTPLPVRQQGRMMSQQNCSADLDSSSFLYDTKSQLSGTFHRRTVLPLKLESFLCETQTGSSSIEDQSQMSSEKDDSLDSETSREIVCELESEWESSQQTLALHTRELLTEDNLAFSEEVVNELDESFDNSMETSTARDLAKDTSISVPASTNASLSGVDINVRPTSTTDTPLTNFSSVELNVSRSSPSCGTPELFSSQKKLGRHGSASLMREMESSSFTPELFGATPLVRDYPSSISSTPTSLSSRTHGLSKRSLLQDSTITPLGHCFSHSVVTSQLLDGSSVSCSRQGHTDLCTPHSQGEYSRDLFTSSVSSPDLFS